MTQYFWQAARKPASLAAGAVQLNLGFGDVSPQMSINMLNSAVSTSFGGGATPAALDNYGYPVRNFVGFINSTTLSIQASTNGPWRLLWTASRSFFTIQIQSASTVSNLVNCTVPTTSPVTIIVGGGAAGSVDLQFSSISGPGHSFSGIIYLGTDQSPAESRWASNTSSGYIALVRVSDIGAFNAGQLWTSEFIALVGNLKPRSIRPMGLNLLRGSSIDSNEAIWAYRRTLDHAAWFTTVWPPGAWAGGPGGAGTISVSNGALTCAAAPDTTAVGWADGEQIMGNLGSTVAAMPLVTPFAAQNGANTQYTVANTTGLTGGMRVKINGLGTPSPITTDSRYGFQTILSIDSGTTFTTDALWVTGAATSGFVGYQNLTVTGKSGGSKVILDEVGAPIGWASGNMPADKGMLFTYDKILDALLYTTGGIQLQPPLEAQCQLANACGNARLWYNIPQMAIDDYIKNALNTIYANLTNVLELELYNECWNGQFIGYQFMVSRGAILGITTGQDNGNGLPYQGLRNAQIFKDVVASSSYASNMAKINRLYMTRFGADISFYQNFIEGVGLNAANTKFAAVFPGKDYSVFPNRPIDLTDSYGATIYFAGCFHDQFFPNQPLSFDAAAIQSIIDNTHTGNTAAATAAIDAAFRNGSNRDITFTASGTTITTTGANNFPAAAFQSNMIFKVTGGSGYSGINYGAIYKMRTASGNDLTVGLVDAHGNIGPAISPGTNSGGTSTIGVLHNGTMFGNSWQCLALEFTAAFYDSVRAGGGLAPLNIACYEGGPACSPASTTDWEGGDGHLVGICTTLGLVSPNPGGTAAGAAADWFQAIINWKNDPISKASVIKGYNIFFGLDPTIQTFNAMPHASSASHLVISGGQGAVGGEFSLCADNNLSNPLPYQWYYAVQAYNQGQRS